MNQIKIAILLCTYQGERFLEKQLISILNQDFLNWTLYVSDDGSKDQTLGLLKKYERLLGKEKLIFFKGPEKGFVANFFHLMMNNQITADYYALADQDDIWQPFKLSGALRKLREVPVNQAVLYASRTQLINENDDPIGYSALRRKPGCFQNALVQNIGSGNTMIFNQAARELLLETPTYIPLAFHDWWAYLLISGCGGKIIYDKTPSVLYRQHAHNQIGANENYWAFLLRIRLLLNGRFHQWNEMNIKALLALKHKLTAKNLEVLLSYCQARHAALIPRIYGLIKSGVHRQSYFGNLKLLGAALLKKI